MSGFKSDVEKLWENFCQIASPSNHSLTDSCFRLHDQQLNPAIKDMVETWPWEGRCYLASHVYIMTERKVRGG